MKILLVGGGSGGHITPVVAIAHKLHETHPDADIQIWTDKKFAVQTRELAKKDADFAKITVIASGKLRRYANLNFFHKYFSWYHISRTHIPNFIDSFKIIGGLIKSLFNLNKWRPDVIFAKGGYVCLPVGIAAHLLKIPLVIHDSDTVAGLTNRVLARWATAIATGAPVENYPSYPKKITQFVGIPVRSDFAKISDDSRKTIKTELSLNPRKKLIFVAGGGGGASVFVDIFREIAPKITRNFDAQIFLLTGKNKGFKVDKNLADDFIVREFISDEYSKLLNACDIFVTRAGATSMAEAAISETATIIVPSPYLAGDHQSKNAEVFAKAEAAISLKQNETDGKLDEKLASEISENIEKLLNKNGDKLRAELGKNLAGFAKADALEVITKTILNAVEANKNEKNIDKDGKK